MDSRAPSGAAATQRPRAPLRAVSGGSYGCSQPPKRPTLPSRLSSIRSASQLQNFVDLTAEAGEREKSNEGAFLGNREKVVESPGVIDLAEEEDGMEPPAKRVKMEGAGGDLDEHRWDKARETVPGSPLPSLPKTKPALKIIANSRRHRLGIEPAARKAHGLDPPAVATPVQEPKKVLDFSPWTGNHSEDVLTETVIKTGYFDKAQGTNQNESNSAKASIWPNLNQKNHHGLSVLGWLFTSVMEKRLVLGKCTAPSDFRVPPRVTVPDSKREAWLRDLANPQVPLRKISRSIPHGIRGKLLMEHCLSKSIPLTRAVWLAKCVGANELRAFRRKGMSDSAAATGESKWIREWTVHVEQFLESVIHTCGQKEWQKNMNYAVKLATAFYAEKLLDMDHYLDWVVSSLADATLDRLPIWIALAQVYWKGITMYCKRGRRLAESILEQLHRIVHSNSQVNAALKTRLQKLVAVLAVSNRGCLIIPGVWEKYKDLLSPKPGSHTSVDTPASSVAKRNERLAAPLCKSPAHTRSALLDLYSELDSVGLNVDIERLSERCLKLVPDASKLVCALMDWASTLYRVGIARVYLVSRLVAHLHAIGCDTDTVILQHLSSAKDVPTEGAESVHRVIRDLVRLESFSVGRYLQWLITSGMLSTVDKPTCATSLIAALPTDGLPLHVLNTRKTLMRRLGYDVDENTRIGDILESVDDAFARAATEHVDPIALPEDLTMSAKFSISHQIWQRLVITSKDFGIALGAFSVAREMIERIEDISSLEAFVSLAATTENSALLATVSETVNFHAQSLAALGQFNRLVDLITEHYITLRSQQPLDRICIVALTALAQRLPGKAAFVKLLNDDLAICEQQNSLAVCSPASDNLIGMHASTLDSDDDIDAVFASGNTMDEQLMQRVFMRIIQRVEKPPLPGSEPVSRVGGWLNQLRSVDSSGAFERLVNDYLRGVLTDFADGKFPAIAIECLVGSGSIPLTSVADVAKDVKSPALAASLFRTCVSEDLQNPGWHDVEKYRFRLQQERCMAEQQDSLSTLVRTACEAPEFNAGDPDLLRFLVRCSAQRPGSVRRIFEGGAHSDNVRRNAGRIHTAIIQRGSPGEVEAGLDIPSLVTMARPVSVQYCVQAMRYVKNVTPWTAEDDDVLGDAILEAFTGSSDIWPQLLEFAGDAVNTKLHAWAQDQLLRMANDKFTSEGTSAGEDVQRYLDLLAVTTSTSTSNDSVAGPLADQLKELESRLADVEKLDAETQTEMRSCLHKLRILLHLCIVHVHYVSDESEASKQTRYTLLSTLCALLVQPVLQTHHDIVEYLFDLASTLSDSLSGECGVSKLQEKSKLPLDPRIRFILGSTANSVHSWFALASQVQPPNTSQQQRALCKNPSPVPQMSSRTSAAGQAQLPQQHQRWPSQGCVHPALMRHDGRMSAEVKLTPFHLRRWEIISDSKVEMSENDTSLNMGLFGARKV